MGQQEARAAQLREESARQEQWFKVLHHHFQLLQLELHAHSSPAPELTPTGPDTLGLETLGSDDPIPPAPAVLSPEGPPAVASSGQIRAQISKVKREWWSLSKYTNKAV